MMQFYIRNTVLSLTVLLFSFLFSNEYPAPSPSFVSLHHSKTTGVNLYAKGHAEIGSTLFFATKAGRFEKQGNVGPVNKFAITEESSAAMADAVTSLSLINADNEQVIQTLANGATLNLATLPTKNLNIRANTSPATVGSVVFHLSGAQSKIQKESVAPYSLFGDSGGNYTAWTPALGSYTLKATPYTASGGSGTAGTALTIGFTVISQSTTNQLPVANAGPDKTITLPTNSVVLQGSGTDPDGTITAYKWSQVSGPNTATFSSTTVAQPTVSNLVQGSYVFSLVVTDSKGALSTADQVTVAVNAATATGTVLHRLNAGGTQAATSMGTFVADTYYSPSPGNKHSTSSAISGTADDVIYQTERWGSAFSYACPVSSGQYTVVLHFAEIHFTATGKRIFDVSIEGSKVLDNYDVVARAGGAFTAKTETFTINVLDGLLNIAFSALSADGGVNNAKISAIEIKAATATATTSSGVMISGSHKKWQPLTLDFAGPSSNEKATSPNPYLEYRLQVTFTHQGTGRSYNVPGFFDGDGKGGGTGNVWRVRFNPDADGTWTYKASFRKGPNIAVDLNPAAGTAANFDGTGGSFNITAADGTAPGFLKKGRLSYAGGFYWRFQDGSYWIKGGADSPENFLGLDFDPHVTDWVSGDPDWNSGAGKGVIGALNYLASVNVNSIYFLPMNIGGDAKDTWPFVDPINAAGSTSNDNLHYAINKLTHWEQIFTHAQKKGILLHFVLNEAETANKQELDNATLGLERKLFYRELVARFGHHNALQWNLCEEYNLSLALDPNMVKSWAQYLQDIDPYDHPITVHNPGDPKVNWGPFVGDKRFTVTSLQYAGSTAGHGNEVEYWRNRTQTAGHPIPVSLDEIRSTTTTNMAAQRKEILWPTYLSGGGGLEYFVASSDQSLENFRTYESLWKWTWYARKFVQENLPFWQMAPADALLLNEATTFGPGQVFAKTGQVYAVYLSDASRGGDLDLRGVSGLFDLRWYNPRTGLFEGTVKTVGGGSILKLGLPPSTSTEDWVVLLKMNASTTKL